MGTGRVVVITGASAGIGHATAELLQGQGWTVVGASRRGPLVVDVDDDESVRAGMAEVASAGWGLAGAAEQTPLAAAKEQLETNFWASPSRRSTAPAGSRPRLRPLRHRRDTDRTRERAHRLHRQPA